MADSNSAQQSHYAPSSPPPNPPLLATPFPTQQSPDRSKDATCSTTSRVKRLSNAVEKTVEKTVDKLNRSIGGKASASAPATPPSAGSKRLFSINRKGKGRQTSGDTEDTRSPTSTQTPSMSRSTSPRRTSASSNAPHDDSPFIRPPSPTEESNKMPSISFRGTGSMRPGTQTLIQALQAIPWNDPDNDDDAGGPESPLPDMLDTDSHKVPLASSIHTIHRPLVRSRHFNVPSGLSRSSYNDNTDTERDSDNTAGSEGDIEDEDFETTPNRSSDVASQNTVTLSQSTLAQQDNGTIRVHPTRTGSMATVRVSRRARLAEKLKDVFELDGIKEVWAELPCWLLRSILLQGYMYLTNSYICFFAHMPSREDQVLKSGSLNKKAQRTKRWIKHWFVLKNDALSWYHSSSDPYFPHGIVDLRYAISCEPVGEKEFHLRTNTKTVILSADSVPSRDEWVKAIRKVIFKAQNMGDSVKIAIPYSAVLDVDKSTAMDFSETIEVKVIDKEEEHYAVDSYFFAYFHDLAAALDSIRQALQAYRDSSENPSPRLVLDTTTSRTVSERTSSLPLEAASPKSATGFSRFTSFLRPLESIGIVRSSASVPTTERPAETDEFTYINRKPDSSFMVFSTSPKRTSGSLPSTDSTKTVQESISSDHTESTSWAPSVPSWLKGTRRVFGGVTAGETVTSSPTGIREMYSSTLLAPTPTRSNDLAFSILETPNTVVDPEMIEKFRTAFAYDDKETLLGYFPGYLFRLLPVFGRLYVSTNFFCFKSSGPLTARTRMALPIRDILSTERSKATRFGHHGLIVMIKGHEELFFEFNDEEKRNAFEALLNRQMEDVRRRISSGDSNATSPGRRDALILEELEPRRSDSADSEPAPVPESMTDSLPAVMFTSASSTFLTFKPTDPLHFTFLTIGSRGDVQPYISLAKGLMAHGHKCRIATHGEFKEWVESHGIEFGYVGGDPAELMRICVENGTFTVSFLKEGMLKFRGWIDDLLKTSWIACQGTDVLIESPSAMGGYHIAEALGIPYFRAFTMTWSRTRAYPHAFAVPERKMGGSYNYMSYVMFDQVFWRATAGQINRWRRNTLNLGPTSLDKMEPHKIPFLYNFSPHVVPPPLDWPEWIRVTGYWFLNDAEVSAKKWTPPPDLSQFLDNARKLGKKVVYIGFGSIVVSDPKGMTRCVIDAVVQSGVYAILSKGWSDRLHVKTGEAAEPEEPLPPQIYPISSIPHDWLFTRIDAACHHGGAGTTGASLRAGIPTIIRPFFGDQFFWADRVEALGVGTGVRKLTVQALSDALVSATTDPKQIDRARILGERIRAEDGVGTAIESIYRDLEYARSLIKRNNHADDSAADDTDEPEELEAEQSTILPSQSAPDGYSGYSSSGSARGAPSEDWSLVSDVDERRSSIGSRTSEKTRDSSTKRTSLVAAVWSVLPDAFTSTGSPKNSRLRSLSASSRP
ncbi:hypothetical protein AX16_005615 [Volvariella volvacea WC 439]|nr:hypothetical protein AX16_005615 [Volvariella volvacea WC 439]